MNFERKFTSEFVINNLPADQREHLLLKDVRNTICDAANVSISVRGRVVQPRNDGTLVCDGNVKPLYLLITAKSKHNLTQAMKKIQEILQSISADSRKWHNNPLQDDVLEEKITVGIDIWPAQFRMKSKILGENDEFVKYIENETTAHITLRGKGSNHANDDQHEQPLHVHVKYDDPKKKGRTHELVLNLIETVQKDFLEKYAKYYAHPKKPEIIPIQAPVASAQKPFKNENSVTIQVPVCQPKNDTDKILIGFDCVPRNFDLKGKIYGPNCSHVEHIEKEGEAILLLQGRGCRFPEEDDVDEPPHLLVKYKKLELKSHARDLIFNLLETVQKEFIQLHGTYPINPRKPRIIPYEPKIVSVKKASLEPTTPLPYDTKILANRVNREPTATFQDTKILDMKENTESVGIPHNSKIPVIRSRELPVEALYDTAMSNNGQTQWEPPTSAYNKKIPVIRTCQEPVALGTYETKMSNRKRRRSRESLASVPYDRKTSETRRSREPFVSPERNSDHLRRVRTPPKPSRASISHRERSRSPEFSRGTPTKSPRTYVTRRDRPISPVIPPPPPVISRTVPFNSHDSSDLLPPVIPAMMNSTMLNVVPLSPLTTDRVTKPREPGEIYEHFSSQMSNGELYEPVEDFKSPGFYMSSIPKGTQLGSSFITKANSKQQQQQQQQQYVKKRSYSPESITKNEYPESKKYSSPTFPNSFSTSSVTVSLSEQNNLRGKERSFSSSQTGTSFTSTDPHLTGNISSAERKPFNGYNYGFEEEKKKKDQFSVPRTIVRNRYKDESFKFQDISSDSDDAKSVICIDSEDDYHNLEKSASAGGNRKKPIMYSVSVQTENEDEVLKNKKIQCICGRFTRFLTGTRSRAIQTDPERYGRYY